MRRGRGNPALTFMPIRERHIDPLSGLVTETGFEDGKMKIRYTQNTEAAHAINSELRDSDEFTKQGIRANMWNVVRLTEADCLKMMVEDGVDPYLCSAKELRQHITRNRDKWGHVLTTRGNF